MSKPLVICIGNIARGDDGVAHRVAADLVPMSGDLHLLAAVGLDIAMAADVAQAPLLVIVDAQRREAPPVLVEPLEAQASQRASGHGVDAPTLLALAQTLYGAAPPAWLVSVAAPQIRHEEGLSQTAETASKEAVSAIKTIIERAVS